MEVPQDKPAPGSGDVYFVLEKATLEVAKVGKEYVILNCDDHRNFLLKHHKDPADYRPDILHQALLTILDSPLNKSGRVKDIFVHTQKNVLFRVSPATRLPRTFKRFCGLMVQLLEKLSIRASNGPSKLMRVIKSPVTQYFPPGARRVGLSHSAESVHRMPAFVAQLPADVPVIFVVGAMAHGRVDVTYTDEYISISQFPLSAAVCLGRICNALETKLDIV